MSKIFFSRISRLTGLKLKYDNANFEKKKKKKKTWHKNNEIKERFPLVYIYFVFSQHVDTSICTILRWIFLFCFSKSTAMVFEE